MVWDRDSDVDLDEAQRHILVPRWGIDIHTKAREGYSLGGFMWERPYLSVAPSYGHRLLVNCAGLLVRCRRSLRSAGASRERHLAQELSERRERVSRLGGAPEGLPDFSLLRRDSNSLSQTTWSACPFDYPVAAALALNARNLAVFERHWGNTPPWSSAGHTVANES